MSETIFNATNVPMQFDDISSNIYLQNSADTLNSCKLYKYGKMVVGELQITLGRTYTTDANVLARGFPIPSILPAVEPGVNGANFFIASVGALCLRDGSASYASGDVIPATIFYIAAE